MFTRDWDHHCSIQTETKVQKLCWSVAFISPTCALVIDVGGKPLEWKRAQTTVTALPSYLVVRKSSLIQAWEGCNRINPFPFTGINMLFQVLELQTCALSDPSAHILFVRRHIDCWYQTIIMILYRMSRIPFATKSMLLLHISCRFIIRTVIIVY